MITFFFILIYVTEYYLPLLLWIVNLNSDYYLEEEIEVTSKIVSQTLL